MAQFVPIKLDVSTDDFQKWERAHPSEGNGIPVLYIVRADGESLYARSGALRGDDLPKLLVKALQNSGQILSIAEAEKLNEVLTEFNELKSQGEISTAIKKLSKAKRIGIPGQIESFASVAAQLNTAVQETANECLQELTQLSTTLESGTESEKLTSFVRFHELRGQYIGLKPLKPKFAAFLKAHNQEEDRALSRVAKIIATAKRATSRSAIRKGREKLQELIGESESEAVRELANFTLSELDSNQ